jgi:hypothetical protein
MCLMSVREEEDYTVPARYKRVTRVRRYEEPPPRVERSSYYREERRAAEPVPTIIEPPPAPPAIPPPPSAHSSTHITETRRTSRAPTARAPSVRSTTRSHYVEVESEGTSSSSSSSEDVRSQTTRKTSKSTAPPPPASEYSVHEREHEVRRERGYSRPRGDEYETYRYVNAPTRRSEEGRGGREGYRRERERIVIEDGYGRRQRDYRR